MSNKISMTSILVKHLRNLPYSKALTVAEAREVATSIVDDVTTHVTSQEGEVVIGNIGKIFAKKYPAATRYNPSSNKYELRGAFRTVRFKAFKNARVNL